MGVNGTTGKITDMHELGVWEPLSVKLQVYKERVYFCCNFYSVWSFIDLFRSLERADSNLYFYYISPFKILHHFQVTEQKVNPLTQTAIETATLLLRIDDIVSGTKRADGQEGIGAVGAE